MGLEQQVTHSRRLTKGNVAVLEWPTDRPPAVAYGFPSVDHSIEHQPVAGCVEITTDHAENQCVHERFEQVVESNPHVTALVFGKEHLSYQELNERANRLAHYLKKWGAQPELLVGVCMEHSIEFVVALIGVLKAGCTILPLEPSQPPECFADLLKYSDTPLVLTQYSLLERLSKHGTNFICVDREWGVISRESKANPVNKTTPENLACVLYSLDPRARSRGTMFPHRAGCNLAMTQIHAFELEPGERVLQLSSLGSNTWLSEIVMALLSGAALVLASRQKMVRQSLLELLRNHKITVVILPLGVMTKLPEDALPELRTVIIKAEGSYPRSTIKRWAGGRGLFIAYVPVGMPVPASLYLCSGSHSRNPFIGPPIPDTQLYILDANLEPVSAGVPGELYISGVGLARGYLNQPESTAERFIPNPFSGDPGSRMHKSGDMGRYLPDGNIEYLGRIEHRGATVKNTYQTVLPI